MRRQLASIVASVQTGAQAVDTAAREIAAGNLDLSERTERQADALQQTAASMETLTKVVHANSQQARHVNSLAETASNSAQQGGAVVTQVMRTMETISTYGTQIAALTVSLMGLRVRPLFRH